MRDMNKSADRGDGNEELGGCKQQQRGEVAERVVGLWPAEFPPFLFFTSWIEVSSLVGRVPQGEKVRNTLDTEV